VQSAHHALAHSAPSQLWRSSVQFYNGPLRSCRKIRGKAAVQQSLSRQANRSPSPRCRMWLPQAREVNEKRPKPRNSPTHNHDSTAPRQHPLIYTGAGPIHPVHGPLLSPATKAVAPKGFTFSPFWRAFLHCCRVCARALFSLFLSPFLPFLLVCFVILSLLLSSSPVARLLPRYLSLTRSLPLFFNSW